MRALTTEWIEKAEGDFNTALRESRARKSPNYDAVCFHCQQCAEKYLKAFLQERNIQSPKVHNLNDLLELILPADSSFEFQRSYLKDLTKFAVEFRYPGERAVEEDAIGALQTTKRIRKFVRQKLKLKE
ncbi:MAG: HEPN domain-containing protein [Chloroflexi bacterium]|nr:HEPN domain-containing protein [Chloroflexota bacterium]MBI3740622.1 HEPN domain-containing protein [Chloroflexota bacterium]